MDARSANLFFCFGFLMFGAGCGRSSATETDARERDVATALNLEKIHLGVGSGRFLQAAQHLLSIEFDETSGAFVCQTQIEIGVPDLDRQVIEDRMAGDHQLESCRVQVEKTEQSSPLLFIRGEFIDSKLAKVVFHFRPGQKDSIVEDLVSRWGKARQMVLTERSIVDPAKQRETLAWQRGNELRLLWEGSSGTTIVVRYNLASGEKLRPPAPASVRGKPVSLEDLGIGKLKLSAPPRVLKLTDGGVQ